MESPLPFIPDGPGEKGKLFGLPFTIESAEIVIIPVPWEVTVSYRQGTQEAPAAILEASVQTDLYVPAIKAAWKSGVVLKEENNFFKAESIRLIRYFTNRCHTDLREEYEGFSYSHASIMHNVLKINAVKKLVQVGIRGYCEEDAHFIENTQSRIKLNSDTSIENVSRCKLVRCM